MTEPHPLFIVDAFADVPFSGNPAAVCLLDGDADARWMQQVAAELNLSETAFLRRQAADEWDLRWFTPQVEVDLCGHATLASAHVLWHERSAGRNALTFHTRSGPLVARPGEDGIGLDFPACPPTAAPRDPALAQALGTQPLWVGRGGQDLLAVLDHAEAVRALAPDFARLAGLDARGVIVTAESDRAEYDFISRFFAPGVGLPEDPVTGSAHCVLGPYWGDRLGRQVVRGYQASARGGTVDVRLDGPRVELRGRARTVLRGSLHA